MSLLGLLTQRFRTFSLPPKNSFAAQTVVITGANTGLGLEAARHIVSLGAAKVILGVRSVTKGNAAKASIEASTGRSKIIEVWELDLERFDSVKAFATRASGLARLDTGIMNAGLVSGSWNLSPDGWERTIQVNVMSTTLLSLLLLPILVRNKRSFPGTQPHLVVLGSEVHAMAKFEERKALNSLDALNDEAAWRKGLDKNLAERYWVSKLLDSYVAIELAQIVPTVDGGPAVIVNVVTPGLCKSELLSREPGVPFILKALIALAGRTSSEGSKAIVDAAVWGKEAHGKYLEDQTITTLGPMVTSEEGVRARKKVWSEILHVLVRIAPEIERVAEGDL